MSGEDPKRKNSRAHHNQVEVAYVTVCRAGEMIPEVEGTRPWGPPRKRVPKCLKGPKTTYTTFAIAEKQSKRSKKGPFSLYIAPPPGPTQELEFMEPGGEGPSRSPPPGFSGNDCVNN